MKKLDFTINAKKEDNIMYHFFPIDVTEDIGRIEFYYDFYPERVKGEMWVNEVGICLKDPSGMDVGTRGRKGEKIVVSGAYSTLGYERREIVPGKWTIVVCANRFISNEYTIELHVELVSVFTTDSLLSSTRWICSVRRSMSESLMSVCDATNVLSPHSALTSAALVWAFTEITLPTMSSPLTLVYVFSSISVLLLSLRSPLKVSSPEAS